MKMQHVPIKVNIFLSVLYILESLEINEIFTERPQLKCYS